MRSKSKRRRDMRVKGGTRCTAKKGGGLEERGNGRKKRRWEMEGDRGGDQNKREK